MPAPRRLLRKVPRHNTIPFYLSWSLRKRLKDLSDFNGDTMTAYVTMCVKNLIRFIKSYEPLFFRDSKKGMTFTSISRTRLNEREHEYIYKCVHNQCLFPSRSELMRFSLLLQMILEIIGSDPEHLFQDEVNAFFEGKNIENDEEYADFGYSLRELRSLYPYLPDFKYINEETQKDGRK